MSVSMNFLEDNTSANNSLQSEIVQRQLQQYVYHRQRLDLKQQELKAIYNHRPIFDSLPDDVHHGPHLLALDYYKTQLFRCLQEINEIDLAIEDTKKIICEFVPDNGKLSTLTLDGQNYIMGFLKLSAFTNRFVLVKKADSNLTYLPTYLPTYLQIASRYFFSLQFILPYCVNQINCNYFTILSL